jgi:hypothetical protein
LHSRQLNDYICLFAEENMTDFEALLTGLRRAEAQFERQLAGVRAAISSLEFGGAVSPSVPDGDAARPGGSSRKKRKMSAAARAKISAAQKARWAKQKGAARK